MVKLFVCTICGDSYIGDEKPKNCPFCGVKEKYIVESKKTNKVTEPNTPDPLFNVKLVEKDSLNVKKALEFEISNTEFYLCSAKKSNNSEGRKLFKALAKVENEHASIWKKILKLDKIKNKPETCSVENNNNLKESHEREEVAIDFYKTARDESINPRIKQIFSALVEVEEDHLKLSEERL